MKLSIVIPMYNAGPFIRKCLDSCLVQDIGKDEYEIIVVNDGSTDDGPAIVEELGIKLVSQPNSGPSVARNKGLSMAGGDYVWFVDADDSLEENCVGGMLAEAQGADILAFGMRNILPDGKVESIFSYPSSGRMTGPDFFNVQNEKLKLCSPLYLFRRDLLSSNGLSYVTGLYHEDSEFIPKAVYLAEEVVVSRKVPYIRLVHPGSIMNTMNPRRPMDLVRVIRLLEQFKIEKAVTPAQEKAFNSLLSNLANYACKLSDLTSAEDRKEFAESIASCSSWLPQVLRGSMQLKYRAEGFLLPLFGGDLPAVHRFLMKFK